MRVAVVNWTARRAGGVETYLGLAVPALRRRGHDVFFWHELQEPADRDPIDAIADGPSSCVATVGAAAALRALADWQPDALFVHRVENPELERRLLAIAPGLFFAHGYYGTCISGTKTVRIPTVHPCQREFGPMCLVQYFPRRCGGLSPLTMVSEYRRQSVRLGLLRRYQTVVTFSEHMRREYLKHGFDASDVVRLPPVDPMHAAGDVKPLPLVRGDADRDVSRLAFIGRIDLLKGCGVLLQALAEVRATTGRRIVLTVAGDGPDLPRCRELAKQIVSASAGIEVVFLGWAAATECTRILATSDVLVMPSLWPEPFGLAGIEAQRRGVPVAAFAVGGIPEWLEDGKTGALAAATPPTAAGLAAAIVRCLTSAEIRQTVRDNATRGGPGFSIDQHVDALVPLLAAAASRGLRPESRLNRPAEAFSR